jgi:transposase
MDGPGGDTQVRRRHSDELKTQVIAECRRPDASIAAVALRHGLNANLVRKWLNGRGVIKPRPPTPTPTPTPIRSEPASSVDDKFIPVMLEAPPPPPKEIRIDVSRGAATMVVRWPQAEARACAEWLREWLR